MGFQRPRRLTAAFVRTVERPGRYGDGRGGHGLSLLVKSTASGRWSKTWSQRLRIHGREVNIGLGPYPVVTLTDARRQAIENRRTAWHGGDPRGAGIPTFAEAVEKVIEIHRASWRPGGGSEDQWRSSLRRFAFPRLEHKRVDKITTGDVMAVVGPMWNERRETARRVRQRIGAVMKWAVAKGYREDNPAGDAIGAALPKNGAPRKHHRALPHRDVTGALRAVRASRAWAGTRLCFEFLVLSATRSGEARLARWDEIDLEGATWTVPADRTKTGREHRVPLAARALEVLAEAREIADGSGVIFPGVRGGPMSKMALPMLLRRLEIPATAHGFRTSFRVWAGDAGVAREVAEACLAHAVRDRTEAAYARGTLFARRRDVMAQWAAYIGGTE
ncbi:tyrosine-type recombinase/integrase [Candidatus Palauibacter sp.]|uniref:tyrosine-type recombinase/integrase n=1 Tax=Candidatus Palauibacter sp. TaxID=3101350 RepID=UPI003AF1E826